MPPKNSKKEDKKPCLSISIEPSIAERYKLYCANKDTAVSKDVREFIKSELKKEEEQSEEKP